MKPKGPIHLDVHWLVACSHSFGRKSVVHVADYVIVNETLMLNFSVSCSKSLPLMCVRCARAAGARDMQRALDGLGEILRRRRPGETQAAIDLYSILGKLASSVSLRGFQAFAWTERLGFLTSNLHGGGTWKKGWSMQDKYFQLYTIELQGLCFTFCFCKSFAFCTRTFCLF